MVNQIGDSDAWGWQTEVDFDLENWLNYSKMLKKSCQKFRIWNLQVSSKSKPTPWSIPMHVLSAQNKILYLIAIRLLPPCGPLPRPGLKKHKPVFQLRNFPVPAFHVVRITVWSLSLILITTFLRFIRVGMWISSSCFWLHSRHF